MREPRQLPTTRDMMPSETVEVSSTRVSPLQRGRDFIRGIWKKSYETLGQQERADLFSDIERYWKQYGNELPDEFLQTQDIDIRPIQLEHGIYTPTRLLKKHKKARTLVLDATALDLNSGVEQEVIVKCISDMDAEVAREWPTEIDGETRKRGRRMQRAITEVAAMHLAAGPYVPKLLDARFIPHPDNRNDRLFVYAIEYTNGTPLSETMDKKIVDPQILVRALRTTLEGLIDIHSKGVWHHDLKPEHLFFSDDFSTVQFIDFGVSVLPERAEKQKIAAEKNAAEKKNVVVMSYATRLHNERTGTKGFFVEGQDAVRSTEYQDVYAVGQSFSTWIKDSDIHTTPSSALGRLSSVINQMTRKEIDQRISAIEALAQLNTAFPQG